MRRGVTLIELAVVLGIIAIMMGLSLASLEKVKTRASFAAVSTEVVSELKRARMEALNRGTYTAFIVDTNVVAGVRSGRWWGVQTNNAFDLSTFAGNPAACTTPPACLIISQGTLPIGISFGPSTGYGSVLPDPMGGVALAASSRCSFCLTSAPTGWGNILFAPGGAPTFSAAPAGTGQQFTLQGTRDTVTPRIKTVAVISRNGLIEAFEKSP